MCKYIYNSEIKYPKGTPFTYLISWTDLDVHYYGVRYKKDCHPDDLWTKYFTSSISVKKFRKLNGEPNIIKIDYIFDTKEEARKYEDYFFKINNCVRDSKWLNLCNGGKDFCNIGGNPMLEETKQKIRKPKQCKDNYKELKKGLIWITNGIINKMINPETLSNYPEWIKGLSKNKEYLNNVSEKLTNSKFMNNSVIQKQIPTYLIQEYLDKNWVFGRLNKHIGLPHTEETKQKLSNIFKGTKWMNNGINSKQIKPEQFQEYLNNDWVFGYKRIN